MKKKFSVLILCFIISQSISAQTWITSEIQPSSFLTIKGSTNLLKFELHQNDKKLSTAKLKVGTTTSHNKTYLTNNQLSVMVKKFTSNNFIALREFFKMLKSDSYPSLQVQINFAEPLLISAKGQNYTGNAILSATITGVTKQYSIPITLKSNGTDFILDGNKKLNINDFGMYPEPKMMGLVIISEWIDVDFHIIYKIKTAADTSKH
ncbi:MAG TPA: YceI family protein [Flavobacterium sp.]|nr:YceI family protein [Flavobacterium sp.]